MIHVERLIPKTDKLDRLEVMDDEKVLGNITCVGGLWVARIKWASTDEKALELPGGPGGIQSVDKHVIEGDGLLPQTSFIEDQQAAVDLVVMMYGYWAADAREPESTPVPKDPPNAMDEGWVEPHDET